LSQLLTIVWLKWTLVRNSLRSSKAVANRVASVLGMLLALGLALMLALGLGFAAYMLSRPNAMAEMFRRSATPQNSAAASVEFIFFSILAFLYLMWATVPLSLGGSKQFDPGRLLMYPISLRKLFAIDFFSEITTLQSVFAIPAILAMSIGAGLARGDLTSSLIAAVPVAGFGRALTNWLSTAVGSLVRTRRTRGETILALVGAVAGLGGALAGQVAPILFKHAGSFTALRWTPPGAAAFLLAVGNRADPFGYLLALVTLSCYTIVLVIATYWIARRAALGIGGRKRRKVLTMAKENLPPYTGWQLPLLPDEVSAVLEKEVRYALRNAQLRMMAIMPLLIIVVRLVNTKRFGSGVKAGTTDAARSFLTYGAALMPTGGVLYVFLILAGISCNLFAFEEGGMRTLILSPIDRSKILIGKNIAVTAIAVAFSTVLLIINGIVFRDLNALALLFAALSFVTFAALMSVVGNSFSIRFPKRMQYGKRLNVSGVAGLLLIPVLLMLALPPLGSVLAGYFTRSLLIEYATLAAFAALSVGLYFLMINFQGRALERREIDILEAVREPTDA
jgi:hypothetical protein